MFALGGMVGVEVREGERERWKGVDLPVSGCTAWLCQDWLPAADDMQDGVRRICQRSGGFIWALIWGLFCVGRCLDT